MMDCLDVFFGFTETFLRMLVAKMAELWPVLVLAITVAIMRIYAGKRLHAVAVGATVTSEQLVDKFFASFEATIKAVISKLTSLLVAVCWPLATLLGIAGIILWAAGDRFHGQRLLLGALILAALAVVLGAAP